MKIKLKELGILKQAEFELGDLTIICGKNNTGKTYATYALYGFLLFWEEAFDITIENNYYDTLLNKSSVIIDLHGYANNRRDIVKKACQKYKAHLPVVFASKEKYFENTKFEIFLDEPDSYPKKEFKQTMGTSRKQIFQLIKKADSDKLEVSLLVDADQIEMSSFVVNKFISNAIKEVLFGHLFPKPFIASAERTGAAIFRNELNFARNRLLEQMSSMERDINPFELLNKVYSDYALPVRRNVDFTRQLGETSKKESFIVKNFPSVIELFAEIIGGKYRVARSGDLFFIPKSSYVRLTMEEGSSAVRTMLDIGFYLSHVAQKNDLLMIDEPELNLHPENQCRLARLVAQLVNLGIKVFITTHSDYLVKEFNTLLMLNNEENRLSDISKRYGYNRSEFLKKEQVKAYVAEEALTKLPDNTRRTRIFTFTEATITQKYGIELGSFDEVISRMNKIQNEIILEGE